MFKICRSVLLYDSIFKIKMKVWVLIDNFGSYFIGWVLLIVLIVEFNFELI